MDFQNIQTVKELRYALKQYKQTLATTIFDDTQGYISVAFKRSDRKRRKKRSVFMFLSNYEVALYPVETLLAYLEKLPEQAIVTIKDHDGNYSSLFLTIDETIDQGNNYQWLVISDKNSYERFSLQLKKARKNKLLRKC